MLFFYLFFCLMFFLSLLLLTVSEYGMLAVLGVCMINSILHAHGVRRIR